jgi:hypothetical protein
MMNWKECGGKQSWPNLCTILEGLRKKKHKKISWDSQSHGRNFNSGPPEYEKVLLKWQSCCGAE